MPYDKRIEMDLDKAKQEIRGIDRKLEAQSDQQDHAMQAVQEHIAKIDNENETK